MNAEQRMAELIKRAEEAEERAKAAEAALAAKQAGGVLSWYIANDTKPAGEPPKGATQEEAREFCRGSISVKGLNSRFPITLYREQWLRLLEGDFRDRFVAYLKSEACVNHYAVTAAAARKASA